jgi:DNA polymerase-1
MKHIAVTITTNKQAQAMVDQFKNCPPTVGAFDTETTGLNIIHDKPFLFVFGWITDDVIFTYVVDLDRQPILASQVIKAWHNLAKNLKKYLGHNIKYDLHMMANIGMFPGEWSNYSDTMFYIRYAHDAIPERKGGVKLALKDYSVQYIDRHANVHEHQIRVMQGAIASDLNLKLARRLGWTKKMLNEFFDDILIDYTDLPADKMQAYENWLDLDVPKIMQNKIFGLVKPIDVPYILLDRARVIQYAHYDVYLTLRVYDLLAPVIEARENQYALDLEERLILPFYEMERVGFDADRAYLYEAKCILKNIILSQRKKLYEIAGQQFTIGQHKLIKDLLNTKFALPVTTTNKGELERVLAQLRQEQPEHPAIEFIATLRHLRQFEKWYGVYIMRFIKNLSQDDKLYTMINQVGAASSRVSSDFQQFPREGIKWEEKEIFNPRRLVKAPTGEYDAIVYLDYSQIELRIQALYTILIGHPDRDLCRCFMPYECVNTLGESYDNNDPVMRKRWQEDWFLKESPETKWVPIDVHGHTTKIAFNITEEDASFKKHRSTGKMVNFAKNYGAQLARIAAMFPDYTYEQIKRIDDSYYTAFPGIKEYHSWCYRLAKYKAYATNLFGVKYYNVTGIT